ncbi:MAG: lipoprotein [Methylococcales bacterium]
MAIIATEYPRKYKARTMKKLIPSSLLILVLTIVLIGCGQKGPLFLPDPERPEQQESE